jgi:hypothetical protein
MSAPLRYRDDANAPPHMRELLRGARPSRGLPPEVRARSASRLDRLMMVPVASGLLLWLKGVAVAAGVGVLGVAAATQLFPAIRHATHATPDKSDKTENAAGHVAPSVVSRPPLPASVPITPAPIAPASATAPSDAPAETPKPVGPLAKSLVPGRTSVPPQLPPEPHAATNADSLAAEAAMLERARKVLDEDPAAALGQLDAHAMAFPNGALRLERELLAVDALGRLGRLDEAHVRGNILLREARGSLYEERVRAILDRLPSR